MARKNKQPALKPWNRRTGPKTKPQKDSVLIVCVGHTEEGYFQSLKESLGRYPPVTVKIEVEAKDYQEIVHYTKAKKNRAHYDDYWLVFDYDYTPSKQGQADLFNQAIQEAREEGFKVAYSNDAFELWLLLHYVDLAADQPINRKDLFSRLGERWGIEYEVTGKNRVFSRMLYTRLAADTKADQSKAIARAEKLYAYQKEKSCDKQNPVTLVYVLVKRLLGI